MRRVTFGHFWSLMIKMGIKWSHFHHLLSITSSKNFTGIILVMIVRLWPLRWQTSRHMTCVCHVSLGHVKSSSDMTFRYSPIGSCTNWYKINNRSNVRIYLKGKIQIIMLNIIFENTINSEPYFQTAQNKPVRLDIPVSRIWTDRRS